MADGAAAADPRFVQGQGRHQLSEAPRLRGGCCSSEFDGLVNGVLRRVFRGNAFEVEKWLSRFVAVRNDLLPAAVGAVAGIVTEVSETSGEIVESTLNRVEAIHGPWAVGTATSEVPLPECGGGVTRIAH